MDQLQGRVAVVTGAASGIGRALAERAGRAGMKVVLADIEEVALKQAEKEIAASGVETLAVVTDVSDGDSVDQLAAATVDAFGAVHLLCNNAGVGGGGLFSQLQTVDWEWVLGVNLWGVIHGVRAFLPTLMAQDEAHIVNTASMAGLVAGPFMGPYNASKFAVVALSETLYKEMAMTGGQVGVSVLCPGWVNTNIADSGRNRPPHLVRDEAGTTGPGPTAEMLRDFLKTGMAPAEVADLVFSAVAERRFYVLTHPDMKAAIEARFHDILAERNPGGMPGIV